MHKLNYGPVLWLCIKYLTTLCFFSTILLTSPSKTMYKFPTGWNKKEVLWFENKEIRICSAGTTSGLGWVCGSVVESAWECAGREWPSRSLDKDTPLQLICTLRCCLKRDIWKTADCCDKAGYDSSVSLLPFSTPLLQSLQLTQCLLVLSFYVSSVFFFYSFYHYSPPSTCSTSFYGDGCPRHPCSVSQMSHNRSWNINSAVDMAEKLRWWWGCGGVNASVLLSLKMQWVLLYWIPWHKVYFWRVSKPSDKRSKKVPLNKYCFLCFIRPKCTSIMFMAE